MTLGLVAAFATALCYGTASVLRSVGCRRVAGSAELDPRLLLRLAGQLPYVAGFLLDMLGFAASVLALRTLPLFLVRAAVAASVGVGAHRGDVAPRRPPAGRGGRRGSWRRAPVWCSWR
jgi:hypothetical protein